ncbi:hypothetical protein [Gemmobacter lutimaris]|uniref:hypothetical protein n=1 Tax=Gemmobacter lutimaris TaxID=2306023 RepID=UPI0011C3B86D|nr:hypothetical protein [Gemmobacter lutimaris]
MQREENMSIRVFYTLTEPLRMVRIPAGHDPAMHPLLAHAGIVLEEGRPATYSLDGISGLCSANLQRFITTVNNDMSPELLAGIADRLTDTDRYRLRGVPGEEAIEAFCDEIDVVLNFEKMCGEVRFPSFSELDLPAP